MSDSTWALIEMRNNLKKDIEATPVCSRSALEREYKTKNREVKRSTRRDKRSHVEKLAKSAEVAAFVGDKGKVYKITKELVNANTKADLPVLDLNGNILPTNEEKLDRWREHFESVLNHVVSCDVPPFAPTTETISPVRIIPQTPPSKSEIVSAIPLLW